MSETHSHAFTLVPLIVLTSRKDIKWSINGTEPHEARKLDLMLCLADRKPNSWQQSQQQTWLLKVLKDCLVEAAIHFQICSEVHIQHMWNTNQNLRKNPLICPKLNALFQFSCSAQFSLRLVWKQFLCDCWETNPVSYPIELNVLLSDHFPVCVIFTFQKAS